MTAAVLTRPAGGVSEDHHERRGSSAGFVLSGVQVAVLRELEGAEAGCRSADVAAATAGGRSMPVARALTTLQARHLVRGQHQSWADGAWVWSLTPLGQQTLRTMRVLDGMSAVVEIPPAGRAC
ncbi:MULTISPECIES: hypothetical protein [Nocardia]|uniref:hypothetical protein n=1 Tax=Nocardia TaxID=1817 RepID=UPI00031AF135|nr:MULTISPECIES: hypothetical protein [Nocardia]